MRFLRWTSPAWFVLTAVGCSNTPAESVTSNPKNIGAVEQSSVDVSAPAAPKVAVDIKNWEEIQTWVVGQRGKIVVLDVWSNW